MEGPVSYAYDPELVDVAVDAATEPVIDMTDLANARSATNEMVQARGHPDLTGVAIRDLTVPGRASSPDVPLRIYTPEHGAEPAAIFDVHGGGYIFGDLEMLHRRNLQLCRELGVLLVAVGYRLAPEHPFPAALNDCYSGLCWLAEHARDLGVDPERIALHGVSAGGGLCAALALLARDRGGPAICFQYLAVPEVDDRLDTPSMRAFHDTPYWSQPNAEISWDAYLGHGRRGTADVSPYAAPARATDLRGLPPAYISAMQFDPLRDEGIDYALALLAAHVTVELHLFPGTFHGSATVEHAEISQRELAEEVQVLRHALRLGA